MSHQNRILSMSIASLTFSVAALWLILNSHEYVSAEFNAGCVYAKCIDGCEDFGSQADCTGGCTFYPTYPPDLLPPPDGGQH